MKDLLLILFAIIYCMNLSAQTNCYKSIPSEIINKLDSMGIDDNILLNNYESDYFNVIFEDSKQDFDFTNKKIAFITGSSGKTIVNKKAYFIEEKNKLNNNQPPTKGTLYIFTETEKNESNGYDAAILYWSKILISRNELIRMLKK